jgi:predicted AAA+ superfamily ATPase
MIDGKEIDFIAEKGKKRCYIQATYMMPNSWTIEREFGNLELINDHYPKYVVSLDPIATGERKGIQWNYLPNFIETFT